MLIQDINKVITNENIENALSIFYITFLCDLNYTMIIKKNIFRENHSY